jgi:hypothetical protein
MEEASKRKELIPDKQPCGVRKCIHHRDNLILQLLLRGLTRSLPRRIFNLAAPAIAKQRVCHLTPPMVGRTVHRRLPFRVLGVWPGASLKE